MLQNLPYFSNSKSGQMGKIDLDEMKKSTSGLSGFFVFDVANFNM